MTLPQAIRATLAYHDIFDYPLTEDEIYKYLIGKKATLSDIESALVKLMRGKKRLVYSSNEVRSYRENPESQNSKFSLRSDSNRLYALTRRKELFGTRKSRRIYSQKKLKRALFYVKLLSRIPTIRLVAVSGALAMQNSDKNDDIDLVIVTSRNTLWTTRFLTNLLLFPFKRKPLPSQLNFQLSTFNFQFNNKACLNIFLDEADLQITPHNLYLAHEICQMRPLWDRDETYSRFIKANKWVKKYLPNWQPFSSSVISASPSVIPAPPLVIPAPPLVIPAEAGIHNSRRVRKKALVELTLSLSKGLAQVAENFLRKFQLWYMRKKISTERIGKHQLFFHPLNTQEWVMGEYHQRLRKLKIKL